MCPQHSSGEMLTADFVGCTRPRTVSSSSSSDDDIPRLLELKTTGSDRMDAVQEFRFESRLLSGPLVLKQPDVGGSIGFKLYPAALFCCKLLEDLYAAQQAGAVDAQAFYESLCAPRTSRPAPPLLKQLLDTPLVDSVILEVGSGICGLPSQLLARTGAIPIATVRTNVFKGRVTASALTRTLSCS